MVLSLAEIVQGTLSVDSMGQKPGLDYRRAVFRGANPGNALPFSNTIGPILFCTLLNEDSDSFTVRNIPGLMLDAFSCSAVVASVNVAHA